MASSRMATNALVSYHVRNVDCLLTLAAGSGGPEDVPESTDGCQQAQPPTKRRRLVTKTSCIVDIETYQSIKDAVTTSDLCGTKNNKTKIKTKMRSGRP